MLINIQIMEVIKLSNSTYGLATTINGKRHVLASAGKIIACDSKEQAEKLREEISFLSVHQNVDNNS